MFIALNACIDLAMIFGYADNRRMVYWCTTDFPCLHHYFAYIWERNVLPNLFSERITVIRENILQSLCVCVHIQIYILSFISTPFPTTFFSVLNKRHIFHLVSETGRVIGFNLPFCLLLKLAFLLTVCSAKVREFCLPFCLTHCRESWPKERMIHAFP